LIVSVPDECRRPFQAGKLSNPIIFRMKFASRFLMRYNFLNGFGKGFRKEGEMETVRHILQLKGDFTWCIAPDDTVYNALRMMADKDVGALLVMENDHLIGIISERDYARKVILFNKSSRETLVREIMTAEVHTVHPDQTVQECIEMMYRHQIRHLPVVEDGRVVGVISTKDVMSDMIYQQREMIKSLTEQMAGKRPV